MAIFLLTHKAGDAKIPEADEMYYYRNVRPETLDVNSSHVYRMLSGPHTKMLIIIRVYSWKGLMNAFVQ